MVPPLELLWLPPLYDRPPTRSDRVKPLKENSKVPIDHLDCQSSQLEAIKQLYASGDITSEVFNTESSSSQMKAKMLLAQHGLGLTPVADLSSRWSVKWTDSWGFDSMKRERVLMQCCCGYDTQRRQEREIRRQWNVANKAQKQGGYILATPDESSQTNSPWNRRAPYNFTGCLVHVDITFQSHEKAIMRVMGYLKHNEECQKAQVKHNAPVPLHPQVYEVALKQLQDGADMMTIKATNSKYIDLRFYIGMDDPLVSNNFRFLILPTDSASLYRQLARSQGIHIHRRPQHNIHNWLDPKSDDFKTELYDAVFHYSPRTQENEIFEVLIATPEMRDAAWKYGHNSQIILDGTFGICDSQLLLFIAMGVDEEGHGVPLAFFLFSAPTGNRLTSSGYDTEILKKVLSKWKGWLESGTNKRTFNPLVAITDTDIRERAALTEVFPSITLLLCTFHIRQCWANKRRTLKLNRGGTFEANQILSQYVLWSFEVFTDAQRLLEGELRYMSELRSRPLYADSANSAIQFLTYLKDNWLSESLWFSWSRKGRQRAAAILERPVEDVLTTTNHLESFNRVLKRDHIKRLEKNGRRLRFDVLVFYLIIRIIPTIFSLRRHSLQYKKWLASRFNISPPSTGAGDATRMSSQAGLPQVAWLPKPLTDQSDSRTAKAHDMVKHNLMFNFSYPFHPSPIVLKAQCLSSTALPSEPVPLSYDVQIQTNGFGTCSCPDFRFRSAKEGACKHLRALILLAERTCSTKNDVGASLIPQYWLPMSIDSALKIRHENCTFLTQNCIDSVDGMLQAEEQIAATPSLFSDQSSDIERVGNTLVDLCKMLGTDSPVEQGERDDTESGNLTEVELDDLEVCDENSDKIQNEPQKYSNHSAIEAQCRSQISHFTAKATPWLMRLKALAQELHSLPPSPDLLAFEQLISELQPLLRTQSSNPVSEGILPAVSSIAEVAIAEIAEQAREPLAPQAPPQTLGTSKQPAAPLQLLPPSPEKRQKRHSSGRIY
ncbi:hypothetical protein FRC03_012829 [Tulasnella sp. 419]|nr:hypothetical protein FRC03_012829 [Tulasnella sp. 419]